MKLIMRACLLGVLISCLASSVDAEDTFAATAHLRIAADGEVRLRKSLKDYIDYETQRLKDLHSYIGAIRKIHSSPGANDTLEYVGNPLNALYLIKRFATKWRPIWEKLGDFSHYENLRKQTEEIAYFLPLEADYEGAKQSILRLHDVYKIKPKDFAKGTVAGKRAQPLSQKSLYDLGMACISQKKYLESIGWFEEAKSQKAAPLGNLGKIHEGLSDAYLKLGEYAKSGEAATEALNHNPVNVKLQKRATYGVMEDFNRMAEEEEEEEDDEGLDNSQNEVPSWYMAYQRLCRQGYKAMSKTKKTHNGQPMSCFFRHLTAPYYRMKIEPVSSEPPIEIMHDFIKNNESRALISRATFMMVRARVGQLGQARVSSDRIGKVAWLWEQFNMSSTFRINRRIGVATGLNSSFPAGEPLQVVNYGIGGQYEPHNDHDEKRYERKDLPQEIAMNGDRLLSFMIYLTDVEAGGATVFPHLDLFVNPIKNAALMWYNYNLSGGPETQLLHAGCPVIVGEKWIANKWIREFGQEFRRPCPVKAN